MQKSFLVILAVLSLTLAVNAQTNVSIPLWPDGAPGANTKNPHDNPPDG